MKGFKEFSFKPLDSEWQYLKTSHIYTRWTCLTSIMQIVIHHRTVAPNLTALLATQFKENMAQEISHWPLSVNAWFNSRPVHGRF